MTNSATPICDLIERLLLSRDTGMSRDMSRDKVVEVMAAARPLEMSLAEKTDKNARDSEREKAREAERIRKANWRKMSRDTNASIYTGSKKDSASKKEVKKESKILHSEPELFDVEEQHKGDWPKNYREQFWATYPRRVGKAAAMRKLEALAKSGKMPWKTLIDGVGAYVKHVAGTEEQFIKHPATWLNQGCWDDEHKPKGAYNGTIGGRDEKLGFAGIAATIRAARAAQDCEAGAASGHEPDYGRGDSSERVERLAGNRQAALPAPRAHRG